MECPCIVSHIYNSEMLISNICASVSLAVPSSSCYGSVFALSILFTYLVLVSVLVLFCADFYSGVIQCFAAIVNHLIPYLLTTLMIGSSLLWEMMLWLSVSVIFKKQSCIRYSKRRIFRPKVRQNAFGGRAPPGPAGGA